MGRRNILSRLYVKPLFPEEPPYEVDRRYQRFDQRNNLTVGRPTWDEGVKTFTRKTIKTRIRKIRGHRPGYELEDYSLFEASGVTTFRNGTAINHANRGLTSWSTMGAKLPPTVELWEGSPEEAASMVKRAARYFGADLVGITALDRRWIYSHAYWADGTHKEIVFEDVVAPEETDHRLIIPEKIQWVIVMGTRMSPGMMQYTPSPLGCAETRVTYSKMGLQVAGLAEFLRGIGYQAIPSINDLGLNIPMAIDAGFGEQGRNGKLITPEFGPSVRLCKVLTDLPLERDHPIKFGVREFCQVCLKCAEFCPVGAISTGERTWKGSNISNSPGQFTWHLDNELCRRYWSTGNGTNCTSCIRSCPFTKRPGLIHEVARAFVSNAPILDPLFRKLDDLFGYGDETTAEGFWQNS